MANRLESAWDNEGMRKVRDRVEAIRLLPLGAVGALWEKYSQEARCAQFMDWSDNSIEDFEKWLHEPNPDDTDNP